MNPADNLELARFLKRPPAQEFGEACMRGSCGRAYYAAHVVARDLLSNVPVRIPSDGSVHGAVISALKTSRDVDVKAAAGLLDNLRATRKSADYDVGLAKPRGKPFDQQRAIIAIVQAESVISTLERVAQTDRTLMITRKS